MMSRMRVQKLVPLAVLCSAMVTVLCACASTKTDLLQQGYVSLQPATAEPLSHPPEVFEEEGGLVVSGRLESAEALKGGHVDVSVVGPDGTTVYQASVDFRKPQSQTSGPRGMVRPSRTDSHATYSVRFPGLPPKGSVVHVKVEAGPHGKSGGN